MGSVYIYRYTYKCTHTFFPKGSWKISKSMNDTELHPKTVRVENQRQNFGRVQCDVSCVRWMADTLANITKDCAVVVAKLAPRVPRPGNICPRQLASLILRSFRGSTFEQADAAIHGPMGDHILRSNTAS